MRVGLTLWGFSVGARAAVDLAVLAEQRGFDSVFMVEGVLSNDAVTTVAGMATRTSRIVIGTGIANVYLRHPVMLAIAAATIADLSGGRLVLGLGPNNAQMIARAGLAWRDPREILRETTATLRAVFAGEAQPGLRPPPPVAHAIPVHWAAMALETCEAAGAHADGLMLYLCSADRYRRGLYTFRRRSTPYPALTVFDAPIGEQSCVKRARTNTPLQALTGLNETVFVECARGLGKRAVLEGGKTDAERVAFAFRLCVARKPTADELAVLTGLLEKHRKRFAAGEANAIEVATGAKQPKESLPAGLDVTEWAAYTLVARVLLNLDETITKE